MAESFNFFAYNLQVEIFRLGSGNWVVNCQRVFIIIIFEVLMCAQTMCLRLQRTSFIRPIGQGC